MIIEKKCSRCGEVKPVTAFDRKSASKDGYNSWCKSCGSRLKIEAWRKRPDYNPRKVLTGEIQQKVVSLFNNGRSHKEIADETGFSEGTITRFLIENGFRRNASSKEYATVDETVEKAVVAERNAGASCKEVCEKFNISFYTLTGIQEKLKEYLHLPEQSYPTGKYVYVHETLDGKVFYVGKGSGDRAWAKHGRGKQWKDYTRCVEFVARIIKDGLTDSQAIELESELFNKYRSQLINTVDPIIQAILRIGADVLSRVYYDESSPTCLRWSNHPLNKARGRKSKPGDVAGSVLQNRHSTVKIGNHSYKCSRLVYALHRGDPGDYFIDHIDGNCENNNISNLRAVSPALNARNKRNTCNSISGKLGISDTGSAYVAYWREDSKVKLKRFTYAGKDKSTVLQQAADFRKAVIARLNQEGYGYTDRHLNAE